MIINPIVGNLHQIVLKNLPAKGSLFQIQGISLDRIEDILNNLCDDGILVKIEKFKGQNMNWELDIVINSKEYHVFGSIRQGGFCMQLK